MAPVKHLAIIVISSSILYLRKKQIFSNPSLFVYFIFEKNFNLKNQGGLFWFFLNKGNIIAIFSGA